MNTITRYHAHYSQDLVTLKEVIRIGRNWYEPTKDENGREILVKIPGGQLFKTEKEAWEHILEREKKDCDMYTRTAEAMIEQFELCKKRAAKAEEHLKDFAVK